MLSIMGKLLRQAMAGWGRTVGGAGGGGGGQRRGTKKAAAAAGRGGLDNLNNTNIL